MTTKRKPVTPAKELVPVNRDKPLFLSDNIKYDNVFVLKCLHIKCIFIRMLHISSRCFLFCIISRLLTSFNSRSESGNPLETKASIFCKSNSIDSVLLSTFFNEILYLKANTVLLLSNFQVKYVTEEYLSYDA